MNPEWQRMLDEVTVRLEFMYERMLEEWTNGEVQPEERTQVALGQGAETGGGQENRRGAEVGAGGENPADLQG